MISQRWKSPTFLNKLWNVQDKASTLAPVSRGFLTSCKKRDPHCDESSVMSFQTNSTLSSLGSKSTSVPGIVSTTKKKKQPWYQSVWIRSVGHVLVFALLFMSSLISLQFHSLGHSFWTKTT